MLLSQSSGDFFAMDYSRMVMLYGPKIINDTEEHPFSFQIPEDGILSLKLSGHGAPDIMLNGVSLSTNAEIPIFVLKGDTISGKVMNIPDYLGFHEYPLRIYLTPYRTN